MKRWPLHKTYFWETAPFFRMLLPVIAGILAYSLCSREMQSPFMLNLFLGFIFISFTILVILELNRKNYRQLILLHFLFFNLILFFSSWSLCWFNDIRNDPSWFGNAVQERAFNHFVARINGDPVEKEKTWKLPLQILFSRQGEQIKTANGLANIYVYKNKHPFPFANGDTVIIPGNWVAIKNQGNPFEFDYAQYCARNNLYYQQFLSPYKIKLYSKGSGHDINIIELSHNWCILQLGKAIPDSTAKGLTEAMLLGDVSNLDEHLLAAYSETGIVHIIAISGGNVSIFFTVICVLLWWLKNKKHLWIKYMIALPLVWFYIFMAGAPPSAVRAAIMFSILAIGFALQKNNNSLNQLFATAVILLLAEPMWLFSLGFQLSFIAVLSLILFYQPIYKILAPVNKISKALWSTVSASIAAEMLVAPLVVYYFHLFPLLFIIANVAAFLFMTIVLILGIAVIALSFIPALAKILGILTAFLITSFDRMVYWMQNQNPKSFHYLRLGSIELLMFYIFLAGIATFVLKKNKKALFMGLGASCMFMLLLCRNEWIALHQERLVVYNINKITHVELIQGEYYSVLNTDSIISQGKKEYILKPAHTNWMAWRNKDLPHKEIFTVAGKTVLLLDTTIVTNDKFPVDYVIINCKLKGMAPEQISNTFSPATIILGSNNTRRNINRWYEKCKEKNIPLRTVIYDSAFVLE